MTPPDFGNSGPWVPPLDPVPPVFASYTQSATGSYTEQIGGLAAGSQYGQMIVNGTVTLAGSFNVQIVNHFTPQINDKFEVITNRGTSAIHGAFAGLAEGATVWAGSYGFTVSYVGGTNHQSLVLTTSFVARPAIVANVNSAVADGTYGIGTVVPVTVTFDRPVIVDTTGGSPTLSLNLGGTTIVAPYSSGSGTNALTFTYVVGLGQTTLGSRLDYVSTSSLALNGATILGTGPVVIAASLTLPTPGQAGSLSASRSIIIDAVGPTVDAITPVSPNPRNLAVESLSVTFSKPINLATLDASDVILTRNGVTVAHGGLSFALVTGATYRLSGLQLPTTAEGSYALTVNGAGIQDTLGNVGRGSQTVSWLMDTTLPISRVVALAPSQTTKTFSVSANGTDPTSAGGSPASGIGSYLIYARDLTTAGSTYFLLRTVPVNNATTTFTGQSSHTYGFRSVAIDLAGNQEVKSANASDTITALPDLDPPVTNVTSAAVTDSTNGIITLNFQGTDSGSTSPNSLVFFDIYVQVDGGSYAKLARVSAGLPNGSGVYNGTTTYQATAYGAHTFHFYSVGIDTNNNVELPPATFDATVSANFSAPLTLQYTGLTIQGGLVERSFIQTVDVRFNLSGTVVNNLAATGSPVHLIQYPLNWDGHSVGVEVLRTAIQLSAVDHVLHFDFGQYGLGGVARGANFNNYYAQMAAGDGYYEIAIDLNGNGTYEESEKYHFYRLLGDLNGDHSVDQADINLLANPNGQFVDVNGDGSVNVYDNALISRQKGKKLANGLRLDA